jgi:histidine triad (HIT) family protein
MDSIFSRIIKGEIHSYKIAENEHCLAFLDINPLKKGHTLVIPKKQVDQLFDLEDDNYQKLMNFAKKVALCLKKAISCKRIGMAVLGFEIPHAHIHLVPIDKESDLNFSNKKLSFSKEEFEFIAKKIKEEFDLT